MVEEAVIHLLFLANKVSIAFMYRHISPGEAALHNCEIAKDIIKVCNGELTLEDVKQEELLEKV